jgi:hypothetical protein
VNKSDTAYGPTGAEYAGDYYPPNLNSAPGVEDADAVITTAHYGAANATQGTGTGGIGGLLMGVGMNGGMDG